MRERRRTLAGPAVVAGPGFFSGRPGRVEVLASRERGIVIDLGDRRFHASIEHAVEAPGSRNTILGEAGRTWATVEHALSALAGLGVSDAVLRVEGPEAPFADASARPWVEAILAAGLVDGGTEVEFVRPARVHRVEGGGGLIEAEPCDEGDASWTYELDTPLVPRSSVTLLRRDLPAVYAREIAPARTFCTRAEAEAIRGAGLCGHVTDADVPVFDESGPSTPLRCPNEPARHKLLDLIGDLSLLGRPLAARVRSVRGGHALTRALVRSIRAG